METLRDTAKGRPSPSNWAARPVSRVTENGAGGRRAAVSKAGNREWTGSGSGVVVQGKCGPRLEIVGKGRSGRTPAYIEGL